MAVSGDSFGIGSIFGGKKSDEDDYFKILGCSETSTDEQIMAEYRVRALLCHPDKHPGDKRALEQFQQLQEAKETLLDPEKRLKYEKWKQSEMCIPYKQWLGMSNRCATTMHWAKPKDQTMIESLSDHKRAELQAKCNKELSPESSSSTASTSRPGQQQPMVWRPEKTSSIYTKFRNYKI